MKISQAAQMSISTSLNSPEA